MTLSLGGEPQTGSAAEGDLPPWTSRAVLVYGPRKAGTTLFQSLLDGTRELFVYPAELKLKFFVRDTAVLPNMGSYFMSSRIGTVKSERLDVGAYEVLWERALRADRLFSLEEFIRFDAHAVVCSVQGLSAIPAMWAAKEVGGQTDLILGTWKRMFPQGKALLIVRNPLMVARAVLIDRKRDNELKDERKRIKPRLSAGEIMRQTLDPMAVVTAQQKYLSDPTVHIVAYEDLVADAPAEMRRITDFLGIPYMDILATPSVFGEALVVRTASRRTTEVFASAKSWSENLSLRERFFVFATSAIARFLPRYNVRYAAFRKRIMRLQHRSQSD